MQLWTLSEVDGSNPSLPRHLKHNPLLSGLDAGNQVVRSSK